MQKQYAIDALKALKQNDLKLKALEQHGIDLTTFTDPLVGMIEMSIATILCNGSEKALENILEEISWWAYESSPKIIHHTFLHTQNVESPEDFINWLSEAYPVSSSDHPVSSSVAENKHLSSSPTGG